MTSSDNRRPGVASRNGGDCGSSENGATVVAFERSRNRPRAENHVLLVVNSVVNFKQGATDTHHRLEADAGADAHDLASQ